MDRDFPFSMLDVVSLLGLPLPANGRINYNIDCPCCNDRKKHLNINLSKGAFRCPRCGFSGGMLDLYGFYSGMDRKAAYQAITEKLHVSPSDARAVMQQRNASLVEVPACPLTDVSARDETYRALLERLSLASDHKHKLLARGLTEDAIARNLYRTTPALGYGTLAKQLQENGMYLAGVPGFFRQKGQWTLVKMRRGILIPVVDMDGRIQGLQIRLDNVEKRKFRWLATTDYPDGCGARRWVHVAGPVQKTMLITEGPMKADVICHLTGLSVIGLTGVDALEQLTDVLLELKERGMDTVMTAFDMDMMKNPNVEQAFRSLQELLSLLEIRYGTYTWDPRYKGLDDYALTLSAG